MSRDSSEQAGPRFRFGLRGDDDVLRALFAVLLTATMGVLTLDYLTFQRAASHAGSRAPAWPVAAPAQAPTTASPSDRDRDATRTSDPRLKEAMTFDLQANGRLIAKGTILPGVAAEFEREIGRRGGYVKTVVLDSPGGSLDDALAIGRLIRKSGYATEVADGATCASACPLVFAAGTERRAGAKASIGVHRAIAVTGGPGAPPAGMDEGQRVSALAQKYLREMGVDPAVWIHAMETPHNRLYRFKPQELLALRLATQSGTQPASARAGS